MVDLTKLEQEIDNLLESETKATLEKWLFNKRYSPINELIGDGTFVSYSSVSLNFQISFNQPIFDSQPSDSGIYPTNRLAA